MAGCDKKDVLGSLGKYSLNSATARNTPEKKEKKKNNFCRNCGIAISYKTSSFLNYIRK